MENNSTHCAFFIDSPTRRDCMFPTNVAVLILNSVFCLTATVQNLPVILAIIRTPSLHTPSNVLLCSLAFSDFTIGLVVQPIFVAFKARLLFGDFVCTLLLLKEGLVIYTGVLSMMTLLAISLERLIALSIHLRYREFVTIRRVSAVSIAIWLLWGLVVCAWPLGLHIYVLSLTSVIIIVVIAIALSITCAIIFRILRRHQMVIHDQSQLNDDAKTLSRSKKSAAVMLHVVVLFFLFYSPCTYATIRFNVTKNFNISQNIFWEITETVALMNASVNPLLYYWKLGSIRRAVRNIFCANRAGFLDRGTEFSI